MKIELNLSGLKQKVNPTYLNKLFPAKKRFVLLYGGSGSGKSVAIAQWLLIKQIKYKLNILCIRNIAKTIKHSVKANIEGQIKSLNLSPVYTIKEDEIKNKVGNKIIFMGLDDPEKLKSITDIDIVWIEEATEISEAGFKEINRRLRGVSDHPKQIVLSFNPTDKTHFIYSYWFDPNTTDQYKHYRDNSFILHTTYKDNAFLDDEYISQMLSEMDEYHRTVYTLGIWYEPRGETIFDPKKIRVEPISQNEKDYDHIFSGVDFGFTHASACVRVGINNKTPDVLYIIKEVYVKHATTSEIIDAIKNNMETKGRVFYCDSAEPDRIEEMKKEGILAYPVKKGGGSVDFALDFLKSKILVIHPSLQNTIREIKNYRYQKDRSGNLTTKLPKENDDTIAALRYSILEYARHIAKFPSNFKKSNNQFITKKDTKTIEWALQSEKNDLYYNILTDY